MYYCNLMSAIVLSMEIGIIFFKLIILSKNCFINKHHCDFYLLHHFLFIIFQMS